MSSQRKITEQLNALSIYHFLLKYTSLEEMLKKFYVQKWPNFNSEVQQRLMFYQGGLNMHANYAQTECQFRYCGTAIPFLTVRSTAR